MMSKMSGKLVILFMSGISRDSNIFCQRRNLLPTPVLIRVLKTRRRRASFVYPYMWLVCQSGGVGARFVYPYKLFVYKRGDVGASFLYPYQCASDSRHSGHDQNHQHARHSGHDQNDQHARHFNFQLLIQSFCFPHSFQESRQDSLGCSESTGHSNLNR